MNIELANSIYEYLKLKRYPLINSILLYKDNELVIERYYNNFTNRSKNNIKSIWKSIISILVGICIDNGYIRSVEDLISNYLSDFDGSNHPYHRLITIEHLLTMTSGIYWNGGIHYHCPMIEQFRRSRNMLSHIGDIAMSHIPGTNYNYKEWDVLLLSAIIAKASNMNTYDFCKKYLYDPLDITSDSWWTSPCGLTYNIANNEKNETSSDLSARDLAKLGFLFLNNGMYHDNRILSREYIKKALTPSKLNNGYGYLYWLGEDWFGLRGYGGQEVTVIPSKGIIYVIQAKPTPSSKSYGDVLDEILDKIL